MGRKGRVVICDFVSRIYLFNIYLGFLDIVLGNDGEKDIVFISERELVR